MDELKVGDVVQLKSGGARMVISEIENEKAHCEWHVNRKKVNEWYLLKILEIAKPLASGLAI